MNTNTFELIGRVGKVDIKYFDNTVITTISLGVKNYKKEYDNYYIQFFKERAEKIGEEVKEGDYIQVKGCLSMDKYTKKGETKPTYQMKLTGFDFCKVTFDLQEHKFVALEKTEELPF